MGTILKRTRSDGSTFYLAQVRRAGISTKSSIFPCKADAKRWVIGMEAELDAPPPPPAPPPPQPSSPANSIRRPGPPKAGKNPSRVANPSPRPPIENDEKSRAKVRHLLSEAIDRYLKEVMPLKASLRGPTGQLVWWRARLGSTPLEDITPERLALLKSQLLSTKTVAGKKRSHSTVNRYLAALSHVFTVAVKEWFWMEQNPLLRIQKLREPPGRVRFLSNDERTRLLEACWKGSPALPVVVTLALYTGMRYGEIMGLRWQNVDFARGRITLEKTKNRERRGIPVIGPALDVLITWAAQHPDGSPRQLLFPSSTNALKPLDLKRSWLTALDRAHIENFHFHDLRHCTASYLAMSGAMPQEIAEVLGHKTLQMVHRYSHLAETHVRGVLERMVSKYGSENE